MTSEFPLLELRQYLLAPGRRNELIELFEREFVESQETLGIRLFGLFCDSLRPDYFVWLRGFHDMESRREALHQFYDGPVWRAHREAANATMIDSDNVLLLRDARPGSGFDLANTYLPAPLVCLIFSFPDADECDRFTTDLVNQIARPSGAINNAVFATYVTESSANSFPRLPVREGEHHAVVFMSAFSLEDPAPIASEASQVINLIPTRRSRLQLIPKDLGK